MVDMESTVDGSLTGSGVHTPLTEKTTIVPDMAAFSFETIPWPGESYMIIQKGTQKALTLTSNGAISLRECSEADHDNSWLCVETNGFFGFFNTERAVYLGHNNNQSIIASAKKHQKWEYLVPRRHPKGGYELLTLDLQGDTKALNKICSVMGGEKIAYGRHGDTLWEFERL